MFEHIAFVAQKRNSCGAAVTETSVLIVDGVSAGAGLSALDGFVSSAMIDEGEMDGISCSCLVVLL